MTTTALVREYLERVGGDALGGALYRSILDAMIRDHAGVYALYKDDRLYYVGLATNLYGVQAMPLLEGECFSG